MQGLPDGRWNRAKVMASLELSLGCQPRHCVGIYFFFLVFPKLALKPQEVITQQLIHFPKTSTWPGINWLEVLTVEIYHFHFWCPLTFPEFDRFLCLQLQNSSSNCCGKNMEQNGKKWKKVNSINVKWSVRRLRKKTEPPKYLAGLSLLTFQWEIWK